MCGVTGFLNFRSTTSADTGIASAMAARIAHRGPDDIGVWGEGVIALAHRRLSIIDLSPAGHQPMHSACGRYVLAFNGEIYNYREIRKEIESDNFFSETIRQWRGHSDTEIILAAFSRLGVASTLERLVGMFAIALWDRKEQVLYLARDRLGEKPLYYGRLGDVFLFGSELKALSAHPVWRGDIEHGSLSLFMRYSYVPAPNSIFKNIHKLPAGSFLRVTAGGDVCIQSYWSMQNISKQAQSHLYEGTDLDAINELEKRLSNSIEGQMVADVPLGAFLSGGVDSSTVVALMQAQSNRPVRTFSIGFFEAKFNEAQHARLVAEHLGTHHTELYVTAQQTLDVIHLLPTLYDEPFADSSQIPTFLLSKLAKQHVSVSLSGDGGDELFAGYSRYFAAIDIWRKRSRIPVGLRDMAANTIRCITPQSWTTLAKFVKPILPQRFQHLNPGDTLYKFAEILSSQGKKIIYQQLLCHWQDPSIVVRQGDEPLSVLTGSNDMPDTDNFIEQMMLLDTLSYLPDDILAKVDRAAMGVSLETRVPLLDHRIVEFAWSLPFNMKVRNGESKWLLRQVLYRHVPKALVDRPKMGFGVPIDEWLRGPLREWATDLLDPMRMQEEGFFEPGPIQVKWQQHQSGSFNWQYLLWDVLMFQAWLRASRT